MLYERLEQLEQRIKEAAQTIAQLKYERMELEAKNRELDRRCADNESELRALREERDRLSSRIESLFDHFEPVNQGKAREPAMGSVAVLEGAVLEPARQPEQENDNYVALYEMGLACEKEKMYEKAVEAYERAIKINPNYANAMEHLAFCLEKLDREREAVPVWQKVIALKK